MQHKTIRNKKVLLVANSLHLSKEIILHGLNLSRRMDASLEILHLLKKEPARGNDLGCRETIERLAHGEPVAYIPLCNDRGFTTETVEYARNRRNILCIVLCLQGEGLPRQKGVRQKKLKEVTQLLHCPVVLYTDTPVN